MDQVKISLCSLSFVHSKPSKHRASLEAWFRIIPESQSDPIKIYKLEHFLHKIQQTVIFYLLAIRSVTKNILGTKINLAKQYSIHYHIDLD